MRGYHPGGDRMLSKSFNQEMAGPCTRESTSTLYKGKVIVAKGWWKNLMGIKIQQGHKSETILIDEEDALCLTSYKTKRFWRYI